MVKELLSGEKYVTTIMNALPLPVLIMDRNLLILDLNPAAEDLFHLDGPVVDRRLCGSLMNCVHARNSKGGCGTTKHCDICAIRQMARTLTEDERVFRRLSKMRLYREEVPSDFWFLISGSLFKYRGQELVIVTLEDVTELMALRDIIPVCSCCGKARDEKDIWQAVEDYLRKYTDIKFSHSICPDCLKKYYQEFS